MEKPTNIFSEQLDRLNRVTEQKKKELGHTLTLQAKDDAYRVMVSKIYRNEVIQIPITGWMDSFDKALSTLKSCKNINGALAHISARGFLQHAIYGMPTDELLYNMGGGKMASLFLFTDGEVYVYLHSEEDWEIRPYKKHKSLIEFADNMEF